MKCVVIRQEHTVPTQFFLALAPEEAVKCLAATAARGFLIVLEKAWIYVTGQKPAVQAADAVYVSASSTTYIVQIVPGQGGNPERARIIVVDAKDALTLTPVGSAQPPATVDAGQYMDVVMQGGGFGSFDGPYTWNPGNPPAGSGALLGEIDPERTVRGIP